MNDISELPQQDKPSRKFFFVTGLFVASYVLGAIVSAAILILFSHQNITQLGNLNFNNPSVIQGLVIGQVAGALIAFGLPSLIFVTLETVDWTEYLKLNRRGKAFTLITASVVMLLANPLINFLAELNSKIPMPSFLTGMQQTADALQNAFLSHQSFRNLIVNLFMIGFLAAIAEEFFFRAVLQRVLIEWTKNIHSGIWIASFLFSFFHFEFSGFLPRMMMGAFLGYIFVWSGTLWAPVLAHFVNNASAVLFQYLKDRYGFSSDIDTLGSNISDFPYIIFSLVITTILIYVIYRYEKRETKQL